MLMITLYNFVFPSENKNHWKKITNILSFLVIVISSATQIGHVDIQKSRNSNASMT